MDKYFYIDSNNEQFGPISPEEFGRYGVTETTKIWKQGMPVWLRAGQLPELLPYLRTTPPPPPGGGNIYGGNSFGANSQYRPTKPDNNLVWAILTTLFCCLPFGIYSIIQASKVNGLYNSGLYDEAQRMADDAKKWAGVGAVIGLIVNVIYFGIIVANS